jgi:hypothetical protein
MCGFACLVWNQAAVRLFDGALGCSPLDMVAIGTRPSGMNLRIWRCRSTRPGHNRADPKRESPDAWMSRARLLSSICWHTGMLPCAWRANVFKTGLKTPSEAHHHMRTTLLSSFWLERHRPDETTGGTLEHVRACEFAWVVEALDLDVRTRRTGRCEGNCPRRGRLNRLGRHVVKLD